MMTLHRFKRLFFSIHRIKEIYHCFKCSEKPMKDTLGYLQIKKLTYPYLIETHDLKFSLDSWEDLATAWTILYGHEYSINRRYKNIMDLGANIGIFAGYCKSIVGNTVKIVSVEPFPETYNRLIQTIEVNNLGKNVFPIHGAVVGLERDVFMDTRPDIPSHSRKTNSSEGTRVKGFSLAKLIDEFKGESIDYLKIDIEGAEEELIENTPDECWGKILNICIEYHSKTAFELIMQTFPKLGFTLSKGQKSRFCPVLEFTKNQP